MSIFGSGGLIDSLLNALGLSEADDNWLARLREEITLTAPDGTVFTAKWSGNTHTIENKLGIFSPAGISGARVQGLGTGTEIYGLVITFGGDNNDLDAAAFLTTFKKSENIKKDWEIDHPTKGPLFGKFMSMEERDFPVESGNMTVIACPFIINLPETKEDSAAQAQKEANFQASITNSAAADMFAGIASAEAGLFAMISTVNKVITAVKKTLKIIENARILDPRITAIVEAIENTLDGPIIDLTKLAGQVQQYIQIFGLGQSNASDGVKMYNDFIFEVLGEPATADTPATDGIADIEFADEEGVSTAAVLELAVTAALVGAGQMGLIGGPTAEESAAAATAAVTGVVQADAAEAAAITSETIPQPQGIFSRSDLLEVVESLNGTFDTVTNGLDKIMLQYEDNPITVKYFSQSQTYADAMMMIGLSNKFLLLSLFGLPTERRVLLRRNLFVPQIVKNEYGSLGVAGDPARYFENVDIFIASNDLHNDDMYRLEAGRSVLVYQ